jgi:2-polyprenyl-3-methyl-5-hydroxy-6-metoxy-1,4-benzoquinol methylase
MALDGVAPGRLLDVGCGDGRRFSALEAQGWRVEGQEIDPSAVAAARAAGRTVHAGPLASLPSEAGPFDAVTLNHVIEHVHDPVGLLRDCRRLLRPGGTLVAITPNAASAGHARFGPAWRGLEPPRHLVVFAPPALGRVARDAGFARVEVRTSAANAYTLGAASLLAAARRAGTPIGFAAARLGALRFQASASRAWRADRGSGEECVLTAVP